LKYIYSGSVELDVKTDLKLVTELIHTATKVNEFRTKLKNVF